MAKTKKPPGGGKPRSKASKAGPRRQTKAGSGSKTRRQSKRQANRARSQKRKTPNADVEPTQLVAVRLPVQTVRELDLWARQQSVSTGAHIGRSFAIRALLRRALEAETTGRMMAKPDQAKGERADFNDIVDDLDGQISRGELEADVAYDVLKADIRAAQ